MSAARSSDYGAIRREAKRIERLGEIGEVLEENLGTEVELRAFGADGWVYDGDDSGYTIGDYLRADREGRLQDGEIIPKENT